MKRFSPFFVLGFLLLVLGITGCGGGGGIFRVDSTPQAGGIGNRILRGSVEVPAGSALAQQAAAGALKMVSSETETSVGSTLTFEVEVLNDTLAPQVAALLDGEDNPVLFAYELPGTGYNSAPLRRAPANSAAGENTVVNAHTTALAVCMFNPLFLHSDNDQKRQLAERITADPDFAGLAARIGELTASDPSTALDPELHPSLYETAVSIGIRALKSFGTATAPARAIARDTRVGVPVSRVSHNGIRFENWKTSVYGIITYRYQDGQYVLLDKEYALVNPLGGFFSKFLDLDIKFRLGWPPVEVSLGASRPKSTLYVGNQANLQEGRYRITIYDGFYEDGNGQNHVFAGFCNTYTLIIDIISLVVDIRGFSGDEIPKKLLQKIVDGGKEWATSLQRLNTMAGIGRGIFTAARNRNYSGVAEGSVTLIGEEDIFGFILGQVLEKAGKKAAKRLARSAGKSVIKGILKKIGPGLIASGADVANLATFLQDWTRTPHVKHYYLRDGEISRTPFRNVVATPVFSLRGKDPGGNPIREDGINGAVVQGEPAWLYLSCATTDPACTIYYTTDGSTPGSDYDNVRIRRWADDEPILIDRDMTVKALADTSSSLSSWEQSDIAEAVFEFRPYAETPHTTMGTIPPGEYDNRSKIIVYLATDTANAVIHYTLDGSDPTVESLRYTGAIILEDTTTIRAVAMKSGLTDSRPLVLEYVFVRRVATPSATPPGGTFTTPVDVTLHCDTPDALIHYTTDGSAPSRTNTAAQVYSGPFRLDSDAVVLVGATRSGMSDSYVPTYQFNIRPPVSMPEASPAAGIFTETLSVTLNCATAGATIRYTLDGSLPSFSHGLDYREPIQIGQTTTLKFFAFKDGMTATERSEIVYTVHPYASTPTVEPGPGTYRSGVSVRLATATEQGAIYYTLDGSTPGLTHGTRYYSGGIYINEDRLLKAVTVREGMTDSPVLSAEYRIRIPAAAPVASPRPGTYLSAQTISLSSSTPGVVIHYTLDGSTPSATHGILYVTPVTVAENTVIRAIASKDGMSDSEVLTAEYIIRPYVATPDFSPAAGSYHQVQQVAIQCATAGATIRYTSDGSYPSVLNGTEYLGPITVDSDRTLMAVAFKDGMTDSLPASADYRILLPVAAPVLTPPGGSYPAAQSVAISCTTAGAIIRYTTDGSEPSATNGTVYAGPLSITVDSVLKAFAMKSGMSASTVVSGSYVIQLPPGQVQPPAFQPPAGIYLSARSVTITTATTGSVIYYTLDGSEPSAVNGILYTGPVTVDVNRTLKAIALKTGLTDSTVSQADYTIAPPAEAPRFDPAPGTFTAAQSVIITTDTTGASVYYTLDGSTPSAANGILYAGPVPVAMNLTLRAITVKEGLTDSPVTEGIYIVAPYVDSPVFNLDPGTFTSAQSVLVSCATAGASIYYTTDGSTPSAANGILYSGVIPVDVNLTLKAIAVKAGMTDSPVVEVAYIIAPFVDSPVFNLDPGTFTSAQSVLVSCATAGASIYYTTDGSTPSAANGTLYSGAIPVDVNRTLKAVAVKAGMTDSPVVEAAYVIAPFVDSPVFNLDPGTFTSAQSVIVSCLTSGASIYYTTDGSTPSAANGILYSGAIPVDVNLTLKAVAVKAGMTDSPVVEAAYVIAPFVDSPVFSVPAGSFQSIQSIAISCPTSGAAIYYTTDGTAPSESNGTLYSSPLTVAISLTLKAVAVKEGMTDSPITSADYNVALPPEPAVTPTFLPPAGSYDSTQNVVIACITEGAAIYFTTDGSIPSAMNGTLYTVPVPVASSQTLKAVAVKTGLADSPVAEAEYVITPPQDPVAAPTFNPPAGTYMNPQSVTITTATTGATIYYTIDGSLPSVTNGSLYTGPVSVTGSGTLRALAVKDGMSDSSVSNAAYLLP